MNSGKTVFAQLIQHLPRYEFNQCVLRYHGNHKVRSFSCMDQFLCMAFAQLTYRESLRDIVTCLNSHRRETLSHGIPREDLQVNSGRRQRTSGLPHLSGLRLFAHQHRQQTLSGRGSWPGSETRGLCSGLNRHRSLPVHIPLGDISQEESCCQGSHITQRAGINSDLYFRDSRQRSRCQYDGCRSIRSRFCLYDGPSLSRFRAALSDQSAVSILRHQKQAATRGYVASILLRWTKQSEFKPIRRSCSSATNHVWLIQIPFAGYVITMPNETNAW